MTPLHVCHRCPDRGEVVDRVCLCKLDGDDIRTHARERYCPAGRYRLGLGDVIAGIMHRTGIAKLWKKIRGKKCGKCRERQMKLNQLSK